jgi:transducin (beta)-like 1
VIGGEVTEQAPIQFDVTTCFGRSNDTFATCSVDKAIHVCQIGRDSPLRTFKGHSGDVNTIRWDPSGALLFLCCLAFVSRVSNAAIGQRCATGTLLASCSDDCTAKIWSLSSSSPVFDLKGHIKEIYTLCWSPTGPRTQHPTKDLRLATASFDSTVKIWDPVNGNELLSISVHKQPVYSVAFSPCGDYIASGSFDCSVAVSHVTGALVQQ